MKVSSIILEVKMLPTHEDLHQEHIRNKVYNSFFIHFMFSVIVGVFVVLFAVYILFHVFDL